MSGRALTVDRALKKWKEPKARSQERWYAIQLRKVARQIDELVRGQVDPTRDLMSYVPQIVDTLQSYSRVLTGWAESTANKMILGVDRIDRQEWLSRSEEIGRELEKEIQSAPTGKTFMEIQQRQVGLIKSMPIEAGERIQKIAIDGVTGGRRPADLVADIVRTGDVTRSRANLIARTEVARAQANLMQARAQYAGSTEYIWRTVGDSDVRHDHRVLNGKVFRWDAPPVSDQKAGIHAAPGCIYNCRCFSEPLFN